MDLQPMSPMFSDVERKVFCHAVKPAMQVATEAMLDTGSSLSFISARLSARSVASQQHCDTHELQRPDGGWMAQHQPYVGVQPWNEGDFADVFVQRTFRPKASLHNVLLSTI